ncbi:MAG TPA: BsuPI-related putative proteinase inhibitor, partial [Clostridiales bacterium]|nr:BsuPI-related putative proteinase inhibitor [Clostridiales bacterium]
MRNREIKKSKLAKNTIITGALCTALIIPAFVQGVDILSASAKDAKVVPIYYKLSHWADTYIEQLSEKYGVESIFKDKNLEAYITLEDFQNIVRLVINEEYSGAPDTLTREAVVYELAKMWSEETGQVLDQIPVIKMIIYSDTDKIDMKYNHGITVAYMKNIANGRGGRIFAPKDNVRYGELAALVFNTHKAIDHEQDPKNQPVAQDKFETIGSYEIKDDKVIFDFKLINHYDEPKKLEFSSGQQFEVTITDEKGEEVYKYSDDKFFTMALIYKDIAPAESLKWQDTWNMTSKEGVKLTSGKYRAKINILA